METVCFDRRSFYIGVLVILAAVYMVYKNERSSCNVEIMDRIISSTKQLDSLVTRRSEARLAKDTEEKDAVAIRDQSVISNPLYPPLGRTERPVFDRIGTSFNIQTRGTDDTFRLVGYLVNKTTQDLGENVWQLFGRQKYRGASQGEFYVIPSHGDKKNMKIQLTDDIFVGEKIRDIYALPKKVTINSPFFSQDEYDVIELPKTDFTGPYV